MAGPTNLRPLSRLKNGVVGNGRHPYRCPIGLFRGLRLLLDLRSQTQTYLGLAEIETHSFVREGAKNCAWMIDVGAGQGELALYFATFALRVFAIEPLQREIEILKQNLALNADRVTGSVIIITKAVGLDPGYMRLDDLPVPRTQRGFVKVDVDGEEMSVLRSGAVLFSEAPVELLIETHSAKPRTRMYQLA